MKKIKTILANDVEIGMKIKFTHSQVRYFYVDDITKEFISKEVCKLYPDDVLERDIKPEHTKLTFHDDNFDSSEEIIGTEILILK